MSNEPQPPALRLKPRLHSENEAKPGSAPAQAPETSQTPGPALAPSEPQASQSAASSEGGLKLRPRPKLSSSPSEAAAETPILFAPPLPTEATAEPSSPSPTESPSMEPKIRFKPRMAQDPSQTAAPPDAPMVPPQAPAKPILFKTDETPAESLPPAIPPKVEPSASPVAVIEPEPGTESSASDGTLKFKLRPKQSGTESAPQAPAPGAVPSEATPSAVEAPPPPKPSTGESLKALLPTEQNKIPHIRPPSAPMQTPEQLAQNLPPEQRKSFKIGLTVVLGVTAIILVAGGFLVWKFVFAPTPPPPALTRKPVVAAVAKGPEAPAKPAAAPEIKEAPSSPTPQPSNALSATIKAPIDRAQKVVADRKESDMVRVDKIIDAPPAASRTSAKAPESPVTVPANPALPAAAPVIPEGTPASTQSAPQSAGATPSEATPTPPSTRSSIQVPIEPPPPLIPQPSSAFKRFVSDMVIRGVFQGKTPRALINSRTVQIGETIDKQLGITFEGIDAEKKTITFKDASGATITRKY